MRSYLSAWYSAPPPPASDKALVVQLVQDCEPGASDNHLASNKTRTLDSSRHATIDSILALEDLYDVLGVERSTNLDQQTLRRGYLSRSRACHPDKFPDYHEPATLAFKKVSAAYEVLSKPSSRRMYDTRTPGTPHNLFSTRPAENTFNGVLYTVFCDFCDGDLEALRNFLYAVDHINPGISLGEDKIEDVLNSLSSLRDLLMSCRTYIRVIRFELCRLVEIQNSLRQLSYFNVFGRTRLSLELLRVAVSLPIAIEVALQQEAANAAKTERERAAALQARRNILPPPVSTVLRSVAYVLERSERILS
ncbi:DnaJ-domain-containing protein [Auriculariales sp. MPI-PUGE-AT-0066]|nr:DnaJ-domain-containing protein [Auriculariales sp. MPI-PUGE-AT-0066]